MTIEEEEDPRILGAEEEEEETMAREGGGEDTMATTTMNPAFQFDEAEEGRQIWDSSVLDTSQEARMNDPLYRAKMAAKVWLRQRDEGRRETDYCTLLKGVGENGSWLGMYV